MPPPRGRGHNNADAAAGLLVTIRLNFLNVGLIKVWQAHCQVRVSDSRSTDAGCFGLESAEPAIEGFFGEHHSWSARTYSKYHEPVG